MLFASPFPEYLICCLPTYSELQLDTKSNAKFEVPPGCEYENRFLGVTLCIVTGTNRSEGLCCF